MLKRDDYSITEMSSAMSDNSDNEHSEISDSEYNTSESENDAQSDENSVNNRAILGALPYQFEPIADDLADEVNDRDENANEMIEEHPIRLNTLDW